jgi:hypothetical protein
MALPEMKEKAMLEETAAQLDDIYTSEYISLDILCGLVGSRNLILMPHTLLLLYSQRQQFYSTTTTTTTTTTSVRDR